MVVLLRLCLVLLWVQSCSWAVDFIKSQDQTRCKVYADTRDESRAKPFTDKINGVLTHHQKIQYDRQATEKERETIYKAMFGSVIVHKNHQYLFPVIINDPRYQSHINALKMVDELAHVLWNGVLDGDYIHSFDQIKTKLRLAKASYRIMDHEKLLTKNFIRWFYEALESYRHELNFFAGTATLEWFEKISTEFSKGADFEESNLKVIFDSTGSQFGIFKALNNPSTKDEARNRQVKAEYMSWLLAKAAGLQNVVNPVIPVRSNGYKGLVIDPYQYEGTLEPFVGTVVDQPAFGVTKTVETYNPDMSSFLSRTLVYSRYLSMVLKETFINSLPFRSFPFDFPDLSKAFRDLSRNDKPSQKIKDFFLWTPSIDSLNAYFKDRSRTACSIPCNFLQKTPADINQKFKDLQLFNQKISVADLVDLIVFWHLTLQYDMNPTNIIYNPTKDGRIVPTVIDYDVSLGCHQGIVGRVPSVHMLKQAKQGIPLLVKQKIQQVSENKLTQVMDTYQNSRKGWCDQTKNFDNSDKKALITRLKSIKTVIAKTNTSVRQIIHDLLPDHMGLNATSIYDWQELLQGHYQECEQLGCSAVTPILQTLADLGPSSFLGTREVKIEYGETIRFCIDGNIHYYSSLDYVFAADWKVFQEGENDGTNLKGYRGEPYKVVY